VFRIFRDKADRLWVATSEGLNLYANGAFYRADQALGLSGESVFECREDQNGRLWVITGRRVIVAPVNDLASATIQGYLLANSRVYDRLDGLAGQLSANAWSYLNDAGIMYLPTLKGVSTYNPQSVIVNTLPPPVLIEKVLTDGAPVSAADGVTISPATRRVTFQYTALSFVVPQRVRFQYRLEGYDRGWISAGVSREISYTNLQPGTYVFRVKAENNDGVVNETGATVRLVKQPYFHQTVVFYVLVALILVLSGFLVAYLRLRRLDKRARELDLLVKARTAELAEEKDKSDALLLNVLPPVIAEELKNTGTATPHVYESTTILFADIVGFTSWSARMAPDDIICELNDIFTNFDAIITACDCERIKTLGDGYLACCGLPLPDADHARKIVNAAIAMLRYMENRNRASPQPLEIRVGVATGPIVGGVVGVKKYIFDIFGDTVNAAFRLESISVPMGLTVAEPVARALEGSFRFVRRPDLALKGLGTVVSYFVDYRGGPRRALTEPDARATRDKLAALAAAGDAPLCRSILESLDYSTLEPGIGAELYRQGARLWAELGEADTAKEFEARASVFNQ